MVRKSVYFFIFVIFLLSCKGRQRDDLSVPGSELDRGEVKISEQAMLEIIENVSSPIEMAALVKKLGVPFSNNYLSNLDKIDSHSTSFKMAYTLGVLGADLGYLNVYEKTGTSINYLASISKLSDGLKISQFFDFSTLKRLATSNGNLDSLMFLSVHSFNQMDNHLRETDRSNLSALMVAGVWIEAMYLTTQVAAERPDEKLKEFIGEQKTTLNNLIVILKNYQRDKQFADLILDFEEIKSEFDNVKISVVLGEPSAVEKDGMLTVVQQETSVVDISKDTLQRIISSTSRIRNKHLTI
jgi:hypothetical protein